MLVDGLLGYDRHRLGCRYRQRPGRRVGRRRNDCVGRAIPGSTQECRGFPIAESTAGLGPLLQTISSPGAAHRCHVLPPYMPAAEPDDLSQEVWREILIQLPKLAYNPARGRLSSWLAGLTRRKIRRLANALPRCSAECSVGLDSLAQTLQSRALGPEDACYMGEVWEQLEAALAKLRERTSAKTYEVFRRRFFWRQSVKEIAAALQLSRNEVRCRYHRATKKWRVLTNGFAVVGRPISVPSGAISPLPRRPR